MLSNDRDQRGGLTVRCLGRGWETWSHGPVVAPDHCFILLGFKDNVSSSWPRGMTTVIIYDDPERPLPSGVLGHVWRCMETTWVIDPFDLTAWVLDLKDGSSTRPVTHRASLLAPYVLIHFDPSIVDRWLPPHRSKTSAT